MFVSFVYLETLKTIIVVEFFIYIYIYMIWDCIKRMCLEVLCGIDNKELYFQH